MRFWLFVTIFLVVLALLILLFIISIGYDEEIVDKHFSPKRHKNKEIQEQKVSVTYFLIDGLSNEVFLKLLNQGELPNIKQLMDQGLYYENCVSSFPTVTGYGYYPFITGHDATKSGIMGLRWISRFPRKINRALGKRNYIGQTARQMSDDLDPYPPTVFELCKDDYSWSIQSYASRGVKKSVLKKVDYTKTKICNLIGYDGINKWKEYESMIMKTSIDELLKHKTRIQWITLTSTDGSSHYHGFKEDIYSGFLKHIDTLIGDYVKASKKLNEKRIFCVISDHGIEDVKKNIVLGTEMAQKYGFSSYINGGVFYFKRKLSNGFHSFKNYNLLSSVHGNGCASIHIRPLHKKWKERTTYSELTHYRLASGKEIDVIQAMVEIEGVEFVMVRGEEPNTVEIHCLVGVATIHSNKEGYYTYSLKSGIDPLGYPQSLFNVPLHDQVWLEKTIDFKYPYAPPRLWNYVNNPSGNAGDLVVTSLPHYDFDLFNFATHGGIRRDHSVVPMIGRFRF